MTNSLRTTSPDLTYRACDSIFTTFFADSPAGEAAWIQLAKQTDGTGKVFTSQLPAVLHQLRTAGYVVRKAAKPQPINAADLAALSL